jgi:hypothetical protein
MGQGGHALIQGSTLDVVEIAQGEIPIWLSGKGLSAQWGK